MPNTTTANRPGRHAIYGGGLPERYDLAAFASVQAELAIQVQRLRIKGYVPRHAAPEDQR